MEIHIPSCARRLQNKGLPTPKIRTSLPRPQKTSKSVPPSPSSPSRKAMNYLGLNLPQLLLSPALPSAPTPNPRSGTTSLISSRDPLSIPMTTTNFRRFVARVGPVFWLQDRVEEILMWKKGWKATSVWITLYAAICAYRSFIPANEKLYFFFFSGVQGYSPRLVLLVPHIIILSIMLATHPPSNDALDTSGSSDPTRKPSSISHQSAGEGTADWQANLQGIQNLMGA